MEKFYIITNDMKDANRKITVKIKKCIESYGKKCYLEEQPKEIFQRSRFQRILIVC